MIPLEYFKYPNLVSPDPEALIVPPWFPNCNGGVKYNPDEKYSYKEIAESLSHYANNMSNIIFSGGPEGFVISYMRHMNEVVRELVDNYNFPIERISYLSGSLPIDKNIENYQHICERNNFLPINLILTNTWELSIKYTKFIPAFNESHFSKKRNKKFISMNGVPRLHRTVFTMLLIERNLLDLGYYSFRLNSKVYPGDENDFDNGYNSYPNTNILQTSFPSLSRLKSVYKNSFSKFPMVLTIDYDSNGLNQHIMEGDIELFNDSYFNIVQETNYLSDEQSNESFNFKETIFLTEKTFRSILFSVPFVLLNRPYSLQGLRDYGYKTFHPYIDESYDSIENDEDRMIAILNEVERLCNLSDSEWLSMYVDLLPILKHNYNKLIESQPIFMYRKD